MQVVNKSQQVVTRGLAPKSTYTRLVGIQVGVPVMPGQAYAYTVGLGQNVWLKNVWLQHQPRATSVVDGICVLLLAGTGEVNDETTMMSWDRIITMPTFEGAIPGLRIYDGKHSENFTMERLFTGINRKFGVIVARFGADTDFLQVIFEVSEG